MALRARDRERRQSYRPAGAMSARAVECLGRVPAHEFGDGRAKDHAACGPVAKGQTLNVIHHVRGHPDAQHVGIRCFKARECPQAVGDVLVQTRQIVAAERCNPFNIRVSQNNAHGPEIFRCPA